MGHSQRLKHAWDSVTQKDSSKETGHREERGVLNRHAQMEFGGHK